MTGIQPSHYQHPAMQILCRAIRREQRLQWLASSALFAAGGWMVFFFFQKNTFLTILGLIGALFGIRLLSRLFRQRKLDSCPIIQLLTYHPSRIVWVYSIVTQRMPFGFQTARTGVLYFKLIDGDEESVSLPAKDLRLVSRFLNRVLPHASFGYSPERDQWYAISPEWLLKEAKDGDDHQIKGRL